MRIATHRPRLVVALALLSAIGPAPLAAQVGRVHHSDAECAEWSRALAAGGESARHALDYADLPGCPDVGPRALAAALRDARAETDTTYLLRLTAQAGNLGHPAILAAALQLAGDRSATTEARATAMLILAGELGYGMDVAGRSGGEVLVVPLPDQKPCYLNARVAGLPPAAAAAQSADAPRRVAVVLDHLRTDASEPVLLRNLARCLRVTVRGVPPQIDVSGVRLEYVCGNWFRIGNPTAEALTFTYVAERAGERHIVGVRPRGEFSIATETPSAMKLYYDGRLIQTAENRGTTCPK